MAEQSAEVQIEFHNTKAEVLHLVIEPWAEEYDLANGEVLTVVFEGEVAGAPLVEQAPHALVVYGWPGSTMSVWRDGKAVAGAGHLRTPRLP